MRAITTFLMAAGLSLPVCAETFNVDYGTFQAPDGYTLKHTGTMDSFKGTLTRTSDGFTIDFDVGYGTRVSPLRKEQKAPIHTHSINGNFAYTSLERANGKVTIATTICDWCERGRRLRDEETIARRTLPPAQREAKLRELNESMIQLNQERFYPANFWADVTREEDVLEFMLIVDSYRPIGRTTASLPPIIGDASDAREATGQFFYGEAVDGVSLGIWSEGSEYQLNHRIKVWISLRNTSGRTLADNDPLFTESVLYITTPAGWAAAVAIGLPKGPREVSEFLHSMIREPGTYMVQWKVGQPKPGITASGGLPPWKLESGIVTFTVLPERSPRR